MWGSGLRYVKSLEDWWRPLDDLWCRSGEPSGVGVIPSVFPPSRGVLIVGFSERSRSCHRRGIFRAPVPPFRLPEVTSGPDLGTGATRTVERRL